MYELQLARNAFLATASTPVLLVLPLASIASQLIVMRWIRQLKARKLGVDRRQLAWYRGFQVVFWIVYLLLAGRAFRSNWDAIGRIVDPDDYHRLRLFCIDPAIPPSILEVTDCEDWGIDLPMSAAQAARIRQEECTYFINRQESPGLCSGSN